LCVGSMCTVILVFKIKYVQDPAVAFAKKGYHILLEKPMAVSCSIFLLGRKKCSRPMPMWLRVSDTGGIDSYTFNQG